jgi:hypothetical protein
MLYRTRRNFIEAIGFSSTDAIPRSRLPPDCGACYPFHSAVPLDNH